MKKNRSLIALFLALLVVLPLAAEKTAVNGLYHYTLDNGLELFVMENHMAPLAYIEIAVKGAGLGQTKETAGLFHLYEHMMFKGNTKFTTAAAVQRAINDLGVTNWNGTTGAEYVNYFFTVPADRLEDGMEFWSYAIREPLIDPVELENEKKVVLSEIEGDLNDPNQIYYSGRNLAMFPNFPWRLDPGGTPTSVANATVDDIREIQREFYVPNNSALFIGGDVDHDQVFKLAKKIWGGWKRGNDPWAGTREYQDPEPFNAPTFMVMPYDQLPDAYAIVDTIYRGPDTALDAGSTYAADLWGTLMGNPGCQFAEMFVSEEEFMIPNAGYLSASYYTQKETGLINFESVMLDPYSDIAIRAMHWQQKIATELVPALANDDDFFTAEEYDTAKQRIEDSQIIETETSTGFLTTLRFWWASTSSDYYFSYADRVKGSSAADIQAYINRYLTNKSPLTVVLVNPQVYYAQKAQFDALGFKEITSDNAYWWR